MKFQTITLAMLAALSVSAANASGPEPIPGTFTYDKVVQVGSTFTYFSPALIFGREKLRLLGTYDISNQWAACRALGHTRARGSTLDVGKPGTSIVFLKEDGSLEGVFNACDLTHDGQACWQVIDSVTCE